MCVGGKKANGVWSDGYYNISYVHIDGCMPHRELGSNKRYLTVLSKQEIVQLLIVLTNNHHHLYIDRQQTYIHTYTYIRM